MMKKCLFEFCFISQNYSLWYHLVVTTRSFVTFIVTFIELIDKVINLPIYYQHMGKIAVTLCSTASKKHLCAGEFN